MKKKLLVLPVTTLLALTSLIACKNNNQKNTPFKLLLINDTYGDEFLHVMVKDYLADKNQTSPEKIKNNEDYVIEISNKKDLTSLLSSKNDSPDLVLDYSLPYKYVSDGLVLDISDVFETQVSTRKGQKKIKDFTNVENLNINKYSQKYNQGSAKIWAMPFVNEVCSIAYNDELLKTINHVDTLYDVETDAISGGKWARAPKTLSELKSYFADLDNYNLSAPKKVSKLGWTSNNSDVLENLIYTWWAQDQGVSLLKGNYESEGVFDEFWRYKSADIYKQTGLQTSLQTLKDLIIDGDAFINSDSDATTISQKDMENKLLDGSLAMCLTNNALLAQRRDSGSNIKMMYVPTIENAVKNDENATAKLAFVNRESCMYIPTNANNADIAKDFLEYTSDEQQLVTFSKLTGGIRPFEYNLLEYSSSNWNSYEKSCFNIYYQSDELFSKFPRKAFVNITWFEALSPIYCYEREKAFTPFVNMSSWNELLTNLKEYTPQQIMIDGVSGSLQSAYQAGSTLFADWHNKYTF